MPSASTATRSSIIERVRPIAASCRRATRSVLEDRFLKLCARHGVPRPRTNVHLGPHEVDACWPDRRVAVELDGWQRHKDRIAFQRDRTKANDLQRAGWRVLRFTHDDVVRRADETAATIGALLADA